MLSLTKINMKGRTRTTVKKYLAHVTWKKDKSVDRYFAIASMKGKIIHADKLKTIAFIK